MSPLLFTLILCVFAITTGEFVIAGILPDVAADLEISVSAAGLLVTAYATGMIAGGPLLTALTARFSRKPLILALIGVAILGNLLSAGAPNYAILFIARIITALITSTFFANAIVIATSATSDKKASAIAKLAFGMNIAMVLGMPLGTWVGSHFGWRATFLAIAGCCFVGLLLALRFVPCVAGITAGTSALNELRVLKKRPVQTAIALTALGNAGVLAVFTFFALLLTNVSGFSSESIAGLLVLYGIGATAGNLLGGWLADKSLDRSQVSLLGVLAASLLLMWSIAPSQVLSAIMVFLLGLVSFAVIPGMQARVLLAATAAPTLAVAVNASAYQLSAAFAGWYGGLVIETIGLRQLYIVAALITCLGVVLSIYILRTQKNLERNTRS